MALAQQLGHEEAAAVLRAQGEAAGAGNIDELQQGGGAAARPPLLATPPQAQLRR